MGAGASKGGAGSDIRSKFSIGAQTSKPERYAPLLSLSLSLCCERSLGERKQGGALCEDEITLLQSGMRVAACCPDAAK